MSSRDTIDKQANHGALAGQGMVPVTRRFSSHTHRHMPHSQLALSLQKAWQGPGGGSD